MTYVRHQGKSEARRRSRQAKFLADARREREQIEAAFPNVCAVHGTRFREACGACHPKPQQ